MPYKNIKNKRKHYESIKILNKICKVCGIGFLASKYKPEAKYCSVKCRQIGNSRSSASLRGDLQRGKGKYGYIKYYGKHQHRLVMERKLGRKLKTKEIVHHIDENKKNNKPSNLYLCKDHKEHGKLHSLAYHYLVKTGKISNYLNWFKRNYK